MVSNPVPKSFLFWHTDEFNLAVDSDGRCGHDAVFNSYFRVLGDINFNELDLRELRLELANQFCNQGLGRLTLSSAGSG